MAKKGLDRYRGKRDPTRTNEPFGPEPKSRGGGTRLGAFVVHQHAARRMHFDLRIETGGALASFAVPRGPSLDPDDKRLAVRTEDHPLDYLDFEAVIPEGNYGAGSMIVWDRGRVTYSEAPVEEGLAEGKVDLWLQGHKLRGRFALVHTGKRTGKDAEWLLIKKRDGFEKPGVDLVTSLPESVLSGLTVEQVAHRDEIARAIVDHAAALGAREGEVPTRSLVPMLCSLEEAPTRDPRWLYELKLDGVRILAERRDGDVALFFRTHRSATAFFPEVARALAALPGDGLVLDGEIVSFDDEGRPSFSKLAQRIHTAKLADLRATRLNNPVCFLVFDVLSVGERDVRALPLRDRKTLLAEIVRGRGTIRRLDHLEGDGTALLAFCEEHDLEGIVAKKIDSIYRPGPTRTDAWVKVKRQREGDFVVIAHTRGEGSRAKLGALDLASFHDGRLVVRGKVGSGLTDDAIDALTGLLRPRNASAAEGDLEPAPRGRVFVEPEHVVRVRYAGFTDEGRLRFPVFGGLRNDVRPESCTVGPTTEEAVLAVGTEAPAKESRRGRAALTNPDKVFFPGPGYTKGDLFRYYESVAPVLLPHLRDRPLVLVRYPDGVDGKSFYQWRMPPKAPAWLKSLPLRNEEQDGKEVDTILVDDLDALRYVANLGCIPLHVIAARAETLEDCDYLTLDFDPGDRELRDVVTLARALHELLEEVGLPGYPKTSGQRGIHVHVPLGPGISFDSGKLLLELLGRLVVKRQPALATMERRKEKREGKVLVDVGQTGRSRTIVAPFSVRATATATVATPLEWDEVSYALDPTAFTIATVPERVAERGDPSASLLLDTPDLRAALDRLASLAAE